MEPEPASMTALTRSGGEAWRVFLAVQHTLRRYYCARPDQYVVLTLYIFLTYVFEAVDTLPYIHVVGEPATGKTLLGELFELFACRAVLVARITPAAIYRFIEQYRGTLIVDEQGARDRAIREILNAGYKRSGTVMLVENQRVVAKPCYGPKILITNDPIDDDALKSRLITIVSRTATKPPDRFVLRIVEREAACIRQLLERFAQTYWEAIAEEYEDLPVIMGLSDRDFELAAPLLAIARVIDRETPEPTLSTSIIESLKALADERKRARSFDGIGAWLARLVVEFDTRSDWEAAPRETDRVGRPVRFHLAEAFLEYVNRSGVLSRPIRSIKALGEQLNARDLVWRRRVVDVDAGRTNSATNVPRTVASPKQRVQRTVYAFDLERARCLAEVQP